MSHLKALDDQDFASFAQREGAVSVDFHASWCGPCKALAPTLEALGRDYAERLPIGKLDIDQAPATAARMGIRSVPTLILFRDGRPLDRLSGVRSGAELQHWIDSTLAA